MKHARRSLMLVVLSATMVLVWAGAAMAQAQYPPQPGPAQVTQGAAPAAGQGGQLPFTGSDLKLLWIALVLLVVGLVFFVATRRRASLRRRGTLSEAIS